MAYRILAKTGLNTLYFSHEYGISPQLFLTYCGYILVDNDFRHIETEEDADSSQSREHTAIGYCSAAIADEVIEALKKEYNEDISDFLDSNIKEPGIKQDRMNETIEKARQLRANMKLAKENEKDMER